MFHVKHFKNKWHATARALQYDGKRIATMWQPHRYAAPEHSPASAVAFRRVDAGRGEVDHLGNVGRVVADPFDIARDEQ
jgi:hypothetical protein